MPMPSYFKKVNDSVVYKGNGTLKIIVPEKQFDLNIAKYEGDFIAYFGIVPYTIADKDGKFGKLHFINCPTKLRCKPKDTEKMTNVKLLKTSKPQDYRILNFVDGDQVILSTKLQESVENVEALVNLFIITGNIPNYIPYDKVHDFITNNIALNGYSYGMSIQAWGIVVSELCRSTTDLQTPYRLSGSNDLTDYQSISVKEISKMVSAYSAIQSENFDDCVVHAGIAKKTSDSPLEKILMNGFD